MSDRQHGRAASRAMAGLASMAAEPIVRELPSSRAEQLFACLAGKPYPFFLDSGMGHERLGRYSFLGADPFLVMRSQGRAVDLTWGDASRRLCADPLDVLQDLLCRYATPRGSAPVPFCGGAVGYLSYDLGRRIELASRGPGPPSDGLCTPEAFLCFYDAVIAVDHLEGATYVVSTGLPEPPGPKRSARAEARLAEMERLVDAGPPCPTPPQGHGGAPVSNFTRDEYLKAVQRAQDYIVAGDIYQVNLSQRFSALWTGGPWELYRRLRSVNPAPFAAFLDFGRVAVLSASPERFLQRQGDLIETRPIKGTRPRGGTPEEDRSLGQELAASAKDRAEHIMIVDLERSDLGRVAQTGTVTVDELMALESYATVHHLTSTVRGRLRPDRTLGDLLRATFPGGSITGAPKIRAMEIIDELEPVRRGVYTGAIGYFSATGDLDLSIAIRTLVLNDGVAHFQVGGGIVYDSDPEAEYRETLDKGRALFQALAGG